MENASLSPNVAVIDLGSNSIKLLIACKSIEGHQIMPLLNAVRETRVSAGIDASNPSINPRAFDSGLQSVRELYQMAQPYNPAVFRLVATSAVRDAVNGKEFMGKIFAETGLAGEILSGEQEALAIARGLAQDPLLAGKKDFFQMDLGGGSFEFIRVINGIVEAAVSLQLGAVRMLERFILNPKGIIVQEERRALRRHVIKQLELSGFDFNPHHASLVATGGAFTVARMCLCAPVRGVIEDTTPTLTRSALGGLADRLAAMPLAARAKIPFLPLQRADILPVALDTIVAAMDYAERCDCYHSLYNLRYGIAAEMLQQL
jgi:exopolyphosphatase/guanosine-5'-triphosphate,3'-diphosphate pyrophosphatase